jgi:dihydrofolate reductase
MRTNLVRILRRSQVLPVGIVRHINFKIPSMQDFKFPACKTKQSLTSRRSWHISDSKSAVPMKKIRYCVAMSLDGYIAGPNGEADWIVIDPEMNFAELWAQFDTLLMGRRTYEAAMARLGEASMQRIKTIVASRTLRQPDHPKATILSELTRDSIQALRAQKGKDIWLMGGGELFRLLLEMREVDTVEVSIIPVLLGDGVKLLPHPAQRARLKLSSHKIYRSGLVSLIYEINYDVRY